MAFYVPKPSKNSWSLRTVMHKPGSLSAHIALRLIVLWRRSNLVTRRFSSVRDKKIPLPKMDSRERFTIPLPLTGFNCGIIEINGKACGRSWYRPRLEFKPRRTLNPSRNWKRFVELCAFLITNVVIFRLYVQSFSPKSFTFPWKRCPSDLLLEVTRIHEKRK